MLILGGVCNLLRFTFSVGLFSPLPVLTVDYLDVTHPERATLPRFEDIQGEYSKELGSYVQFPHFNLRTQGLRGSEDARLTTYSCLRFRRV